MDPPPGKQGFKEPLESRVLGCQAGFGFAVLHSVQAMLHNLCSC